MEKRGKKGRAYFFRAGAPREGFLDYSECGAEKRAFEASRPLHLGATNCNSDKKLWYVPSAHITFIKEARGISNH